MRKTLDQIKVHPEAQKAISGFHSQLVQEVDGAIKQHDWVVVGMAQNPVVKNARKYLTKNGVQFHYIERGSYLSKWKERLAVKLWSGWPTFPQVFHKGVLIGGFSNLIKYWPPKH